jgi:hypothetical protein
MRILYSLSLPTVSSPNLGTRGSLEGMEDGIMAHVEKTKDIGHTHFHCSFCLQQIEQRKYRSLTMAVD